MFEVGKRYRTFEGKVVQIVASQDGPGHRGYECVQGNDISPTTGEGIWRYNREGDYGRVTGSKWTNPDNLIPCAI